MQAGYPQSHVTGDNLNDHEPKVEELVLCCIFMLVVFICYGYWSSGLRMFKNFNFSKSQTTDLRLRTGALLHFYASLFHLQRLLLPQVNRLVFLYENV